MTGSYRNKKVFVTGHTGFKGSWLSLWLQRLGADVKGYSLAPDTDPNHFGLLNLLVASEINDIRNYQALENSLTSFQPDIVFHLAAQPLVRLSYQDPLGTFSSNVMGTANLLQAVRSCPGVRAVVVITTDKVYENTEQEKGYTETDPLGGYDPYSASKACAELVTQSYLRSYFHPNDYGKKHSTLVASARAGNVVGGGDWATDRLIPDIVRSAVTGQALRIRYPASTRPWQHVLDCLHGYLLLGERLLSGDTSAATAWNFGPLHYAHIPVREVVRIASEYFPSLQAKYLSEEIPHEAGKLHLDVSKAAEQLNWKPLYNEADLFREIFDWYSAYYTNGKIMSAEILGSYMNRLNEQQ